MNLLGLIKSKSQYKVLSKVMDFNQDPLTFDKTYYLLSIFLIIPL